MTNLHSVHLVVVLPDTLQPGVAFPTGAANYCETWADWKSRQNYFRCVWFFVTGQASEWYPAIAALPDPPPAIWLEAPGKINEELKKLGPIAKGWQQMLYQERCGLEQTARNVFQEFGDDLDISENDILWGIAQAMACTMGDRDETSWVPLVDLISHDADAPPVFT